jgi:surfactin synthase thioesterase subunit
MHDPKVLLLQCPDEGRALLNRAVLAFIEGYSEALINGVDQPLHAAIAELLGHCGGEMLALDVSHPHIEAHQAAHRFFAACSTMEVEQ